MTNEVFGKPVTGDITQSRGSGVVQRDPVEFMEGLDKLFEDPRVEAIRWSQYTPYFNDGEPCEFSVDEYSIGIKFFGLDENDSTYRNDGFITDDDVYSYPDGFKANLPDHGRVYKTEINGVDISGIDKLLEIVPIGDHHMVFLRESFGDHAEVTATREGFHVEYYEHD